MYVDNASSDGSCEVIESTHLRVRVMRNSWNAGFAGGNNIGIQYALDTGADYVFLVNPDTRTPPDLVQNLVDFMEAWPEYGIVGPLQLAYKQTPGEPSVLNSWSQDALEAGERHVFYHTWPHRASEAGPEAGRGPQTLEHAYVQGCALFGRAEAMRRVGLFDLTYHCYYEETDLCRRVRWGGWRVALLLDLTIEHYGGGSSPPSSYRRLRMLRNKYYFLLTDPRWRWRDCLRLAVRWIGLDLRRRGAAPADSFPTAASDLARGMAWCLTRSARIASVRSANRGLISRGAGGPLALGHGLEPHNQKRGAQWHTA